MFGLCNTFVKTVLFSAGLCGAEPLPEVEAAFVINPDSYSSYFAHVSVDDRDCHFLNSVEGEALDLPIARTEEKTFPNGKTIIICYPEY